MPYLDDDFQSEYHLHKLDRNDLLDNPLEQFMRWLAHARETKIPEPTAMVLATCTKSCRPSTRTVLLKHADEQGLIFFTNYESRKAHEIEENPYASATFLWKELERQVNIQGKVKKTSLEISRHYFATRPRKSQLGAAASHQGAVITSRKLLEDEYDRLDQLYKGKDVPCPNFWGGFILKPDLYEFWQGRPSRLHDRFRYRLDNGRWIIERLSP